VSHAPHCALQTRHACTHAHLLARTYVRTHAHTLARSHARRHAHVRSLVPCAPHARICVSDAAYHIGRCALLPRQSCLLRPRGGASGRSVTGGQYTHAAPPRRRQGPVCVYVLCVHTYISVQLADTHRAAHRGVHLVGIEEDDRVLHEVAHLQGQVHRRRTSHAHGAGVIVRARPGARKVNSPSDLQQGKARREAERENHSVLGIHCPHRRELSTRTPQLG
jgi:hypothetical protein